MVIAIDGPAGSGKSTIARLVAERRSFLYVNSGSLYRAAAYEAVEAGIDTGDAAGLAALAARLDLEYRGDGSVLSGGRDLTPFLRSDAVEAVVAQVSAVPAVRERVNAVVRSVAARRDVVVEGRDMSTVVFPDADFKFYLDASADSRARRRLGQGTSGLGLEEIRANIEMRDAIDKAKASGALRISPDAAYLDTSGLTIEAVYEIVNRKISPQGNPMGDKEVGMGAQNPSKTSIQTQLQEEYLKSMNHLEEGELVDGVVIQVTSDYVFIDVGAKSEGKIPLVEFDAAPKVGDTVPVVLIKKETYSGEVVVSKKKADEKIYWRNLANAFKDGTTVEGVIEKEIKGGFEVNLGHGLRAFLPVSKADSQRVEKGDYLIGVKSLFYVERIYSEKRVNIVLNRRKWLEEETERKREEFFKTVQIGDDVKGEVKSFTSFGAFIDLGGFDGLLHINDMSWGHVTRPKDFVKKGQEIDLKVIRLDPEEKRINLSLKHFSNDPWLTFEERYHVGDVVDGKVTKLTDYGAFIEVEEGIEGLAHISEFSWVRKVRKPEEMLKPGDPVKCMILGYDLQAGKVSLGLKQVQDNPWDQVSTKYPVGMRMTRKVVKLTAAGAFVELEDGIDGFLHMDDLSWTKHVKNASSELQEGQELEVMVIESDADNRNIRLGVKQLSEDPWTSFATAFRVGSIVDGTVSSITDFGVFVKVQGDIEGLVNKSNLSQDREVTFEDAVKKLEVGQAIKAVITELSPDRQKLSLSVRDLVRKQQREEMSRFMHDDGEGGEGFTLGDLLKQKGDKN